MNIRTDTSISASSPLMGYARLDARFVRGEGAWLEDAAGRRYLDAISGIAVCGLGHAHPAIAEAIASQARRLIHTSNLYCIEEQERLAATLLPAAGMDSAFFCNSGAEANEAAIKLARLHARRLGIARPRIGVMSGAFHGRTLGALAASDKPSIQRDFEPLPEGFVRIPFGDLDAARALLEDESVAAILAEPIQGEAGIVIPPAGWLAGLARACAERGRLLMLDEVQTGNARAGEWFACQLEGVRPDVLTTAKGLGNGVPIGACLARGEAATLFEPGSHASTFGGNPLACAAARATMAVIESEGLRERAARLGARLLAELGERLAGCGARVREVRGCGLLLAVELDAPAEGLAERALAERLLINVTAGNVVRLLPPLVLSDAEAEELLERLVPLIAATA